MSWEHSAGPARVCQMKGNKSKMNQLAAVVKLSTHVNWASNCLVGDHTSTSWPSNSNRGLGTDNGLVSVRRLAGHVTIIWRRRCRHVAWILKGARRVRYLLGIVAADKIVD